MTETTKFKPIETRIRVASFGWKSDNMLNYSRRPRLPINRDYSPTQIPVNHTGHPNVS